MFITRSATALGLSGGSLPRLLVPAMITKTSGFALVKSVTFNLARMSSRLFRCQPEVYTFQLMKFQIPDGLTSVKPELRE